MVRPKWDTDRGVGFCLGKCVGNLKELVFELDLGKWVCFVQVEMPLV